jgi:DNA invertase Pin-like site-specific DNA recombinase
MRTARRSATRAGAGPLFVSYFRVSTDKQGVSGLGLEAQRQAVTQHVTGAGGTVIAEYTEIETGTNKRHRPQMAEALSSCRLRRAILIIAKLDRLARNVHFISGLMESGVEFVACDNPHATKILVHIMAAFAEYEAEAISGRTTAALAVVKAELAAGRGWISRRSGERIDKLGNPNLRRGDRFGDARVARKARTAKADQYAGDVLPLIEAARKAGCRSLGDVARALTARGIETPAGNFGWNSTQVRRVLARAAAALDGARTGSF